MHPMLTLDPAVRQTLQAGGAVVALESTLITHGLPYPTNVETALAMEQAVRDAGAVPATVAVLGGALTVGIGADAITRLGEATPGSVRKCSRRDLPIAVGLGENGATTVAGTMFAAHLAGVQVFATGGIGGVHRGQPFDVSADLPALGSTPVAVVCSGAKAILDLPLTREMLETQGVPVLGWHTDDFPAFYWASSGLPADARVHSADEAARVIAAAFALGTGSGVLLGVPVPPGAALTLDDLKGAIQQATAEAAAQGVVGHGVTPAVLARLDVLTGGAARRANVALLVNNARVAAEVAVALAAQKAAATHHA